MRGKPVHIAMMAGSDELIEPSRSLSGGIGPRHRDHVEAERPRFLGQRLFERGVGSGAQKSRSA